MKITTTRRISQIFFFSLFIWFTIVCTFGTGWWQLRGWPVNFILQLDPLVAVGTLLTTHTVYKGLIWGGVTIILTLLLGRFFCGWICPFGTLHQFIGYLGNKKRKTKAKIAANRYRKASVLKYFFLFAFLAGAAFPLGEKTLLLTGLLDPIPFLHRSFQIVVLPLADRIPNLLWVAPRVYEGAFFIGALFVTFLSLNLMIPRFFCRFICPTGALLGLIAKFSIFRLGKKEAPCSNCLACETHCEGACEPAGTIRINECVLCFNCYAGCNDHIMAYQLHESADGDMSSPDFTRRGFVLSSVSGIFAVQLLPLSVGTAGIRDHDIRRPPGSLFEEAFIQRCIKCGQCMRICPTNIIVPSGVFGGLENIWTPVLNFTDGTSGCQLTCTACGHVCPTSAIRPITPQEKLGIGDYASNGPIKIGTAFVNRSRCLPWAMNTPCIVCQENCPVTPKAIYVRDIYETVREGLRRVIKTESNFIYLSGSPMKPDIYGTGDHYLALSSSGIQNRYRIMSNTSDSVAINPADTTGINVSETVRIEVLLHQPLVDMDKCIGCGTCEHECPVNNPRAIHITAQNESRNPSAG